MTLLTIITLWVLGCALLAVLNARFWTIFPNSKDPEYIAKMRNIEPVIKPTPIPKKHYFAYYRDWAIFIAIICIVCGIIF